MRAVLWGPGRKPRVWGLLVHLLTGIVEHQVAPARGGIQEAEPEPQAGNGHAPEGAVSLLGDAVLPTVR